MPRKARPAPPDQPEIDAAVGIGLLETQIEKARALLAARPLGDNAYGQWELLTRNYLEKAFGRGSPNVASVTDVGHFGSFPMNAAETWWENHRVESLATKVTRLEGLVELLQTERQLRDGDTITGSRPTVTGRRIFLVHGHDHAVLQEVARYLERLDQEVVILREQPNSGRTIIEKFENFSDVAFAIVLLTPDERGGATTVSSEDQLPRARQNVILELGYFLGRLGRSRVCALYREGVEIPSDYSGVLYVRLDEAGGWRLELAKELKAAGLQVDMNRAL